MLAAIVQGEAPKGAGIFLADVTRAGVTATIGVVMYGDGSNAVVDRVFDPRSLKAIAAAL